MKYILLAFLGLLSACSPQVYVSTPLITKERAVEIKKEILDQRDKYGLTEKGENAFYRYGFFVLALQKHDILLPQDAMEYCSALDLVKNEHGYNSRPEEGSRYMSTDDYTATIMGLYFTLKVDNCARRHLEHLYVVKQENKLRVGAGVWNGVVVPLFVEHTREVPIN